MNTSDGADSPGTIGTPPGWDPRTVRKGQFGCFVIAAVAVASLVLAAVGSHYADRSRAWEIASIVGSSVLAFGFLGFLVFVFLDLRRRKRQSPTLAADLEDLPGEARRFATEHGFDYAAAGGADVLDGLVDTPFSPRHEDRRAIDVVRGEVHGWAFVMFRYTYRRTAVERDRGRSAPGGAAVNMHDSSVVLFRLPTALPDLTVGPEHPVGVLAPGLAPIDVDLEDEQFNRFYRVRGAGDVATRRFATDLLNPRAVQALMAVEPFAWCVRGDALYAYDPISTFRSAMWPRTQALAGVLAAAPAFIWTDRTGRV